jgi:mono/diheme cytochrome c family protein
MCHGQDGKMQPKVDLLSKASLATRDVKKILINGNGGGMMSLKDQLSDAEMDAVVKYLNDTAK